jgi:mannitol-1-/sugar-/sorbitol-6-phosphatase
LKISCSALLFDIDGVLVQSRAAVERQWVRWAREHGLDPDHVVHIAHGRPTIDTVREVLPGGDAEAELRVMEEREIEDLEGVHAIEGATELLASIPAGRWTVVTSGTRALAETRLRHSHLPVPHAMVTASDIVQGKPHPEPYIKGAAALGFPSSECVVVEDAPSGIRAGHAAGSRVIAVPTTYAFTEIAIADYVVEKLSDLRVRVTDASEAKLEILLPDRNQ